MFKGRSSKTRDFVFAATFTQNTPIGITSKSIVGWAPLGREFTLPMITNFINSLGGLDEGYEVAAFFTHPNIPYAESTRCMIVLTVMTIGRSGVRFAQKHREVLVGGDRQLGPVLQEMKDYWQGEGRVITSYAFYPLYL